MHRLVRNIAGALALAALATPWLALAASAPAAGRTERVVCVSKQLNEFLFAIGAQGVLVGRDLTSVYPPAIRKVPSVGYHRALSAEGIVSTRPTVLLTDGNVGPDAVMSQVRQVGIPVEVMRAGATPDSAMLLLRALGARFQREAQAERVIASWKKGMDEVRADSARVRGARPRVLVMHFGQIVNDYLGIKSGGPADHVIRWAGGINALDSLGGMSRLNAERIAQIAPDVILATDVGFDRVGSVERFAALPGVSLTPAGRNRRVYRIDESELMYYGPRTPAAVRHVSGLLHP